MNTDFGQFIKKKLNRKKSKLINRLRVAKSSTIHLHSRGVRP